MKLILCPLKKEWLFLVESFEAQGLRLDKRQNQGKWYFEIPEIEAYLCIGGHGKVNYALMTQFWPRHFQNIKQIIAVGAAGALQNTLDVGDVLCVTQIVEHDFKEEFDQRATLPCFELPTLKANSVFEGFKVHAGILASGDEDIMSVERGQELIELTKAQAVAWESAGGIRAAQLLEIPYYEVRGITDQTQGDVAGDFEKNLKPAMNHCGQFILDSIK